MSVETAPTVLSLAGLLAGLGPETPWPAAAGDGAGRRTCIDAGAGVVLGVRAPGPRAFDMQVRIGAHDGVEEWVGLRATPATEPVRSSRRVWTTREGGPVLDGDPFAALLQGRGRVWGVEQDDAGAPVSVSWQLHRDAPAAATFDRLGLSAAWAAASAALDALHGFAVSGTSGPWSISAPLSGDAGGPVRIGTTRWAWSVDDHAKGVRLADWIGRHDGDRAYASALYDLMARDESGRTRVGRAAEIDVVDGEVAGVSAYLVVPRTTSTPPPTEGSRP